MSKPEFRGISASEEKLVKDLLKDTRTPQEKFRQNINKNLVNALPVILLIISFITPSLREYLLIMAIFVYYKYINILDNVPLEKPKSFQEIDENNIHPGTGKAQIGEGISYYGQERESGREVWFSADKIKTHTLIFGTTGSGKTEYLLSICQNALIHGSGFIYVDGKGDTLLFEKVFALVRRLGRDDDLLTINFMNQGIESKDSGVVRSNTLNPFAKGSSEELTELIVSLLPSDGDGMWKGRAANFMDGLMRVLVALRNDNKLLLDVNTIRKYFSLDVLIKLIQRTDIKEKHLDGLKTYIENLPGYQAPTEKKPNPEQDIEVYNQHGYITMQYTEVFGLLADQYAYIMKTQLGEVDFFDVVVRRRILVVLLPALSKSAQNLSNLGKIIVTSVRSMMSHSLGGEIEGKTEEIIDAKPTSASAPYLSIFDEYGYYSVKGAAVMPAQARSLNFSMVFAGQDYAAFKKGSEEDAESIVANCTIKICMKIDELKTTAPIFVDSAGEGIVEEIGGKDKIDANERGLMGGKYKDSKHIQFQKKNRIDPRDLRKQSAGEAHLLYGDTLARIKAFYANPEKPKEIATNTFLKVKPPNHEKITLLNEGLKSSKRKFREILKEPEKYKSNIAQTFKEIGYTSELSTLLNAATTKQKLKLNDKTFSVLPLAMFIEKVEFIDDKVVENSQKTYQEKTDEEIEDAKNKGETDIGEYQEKEKEEEDVENVIRKNERKNKIEQKEEDKAESVRIRIQNNMNKRTNELKKVNKEAQETFKILNMNAEATKKKVNNIEKKITQFLGDNDIEVETGYEETTGDNTILEIGYQTTINTRNEGQTRTKDKDKFIDSILNDINKNDLGE